MPQLPEDVVPRPNEVKFSQPVIEIARVTSLDKTLTTPGILSLNPGAWSGVPGNPNSICDLPGLDRVPHATVQPAPDLLRGLRLDGAMATVTVEFVVNQQGQVVSAEAVHYTHRELVEPALRAVLKWRFEAGTRSGRPVAFRMAVPIEFSLNDC